MVIPVIHMMIPTWPLFPVKAQHFPRVISKTNTVIGGFPCTCTGAFKVVWEKYLSLNIREFGNSRILASEGKVGNFFLGSNPNPGGTAL